MQEINLENITTDKISLPLLIQKKITIDVLRTDKIHPVVSGNKWFKLNYYIQEAIKQSKETIVTFGGAWSNHIVATAALCKLKGLKSIGIIRGEEPKILSATLIEAKSLGMQLHFTSREYYHEKKIPDVIKHEPSLLIPEGGYGTVGAKGASEILNHCNKSQYTHVCCAAGTGTMAAGLINSIGADQQVITFSVLKNYVELEEKIRYLLIDKKRAFTVNHNYHFGGYAKMKPALINFMNDFYAQTNIPTDFVYTGKLFFGVMDLVSNDTFNSGSRIFVIHSGGLQGNKSLNKRTLIF